MAWQTQSGRKGKKKQGSLGPSSRPWVCCTNESCRKKNGQRTWLWSDLAAKNPVCKHCGSAFITDAAINHPARPAAISDEVREQYEKLTAKKEEPGMEAMLKAMRTQFPGIEKPRPTISAQKQVADASSRLQKAVKDHAMLLDKAVKLEEQLTDTKTALTKACQELDQAQEAMDAARATTARSEPPKIAARAAAPARRYVESADFAVLTTLCTDEDEKKGLDTVKAQHAEYFKAAGAFHTCAVRGTLVCFGLNDVGQCDVPSDLGHVRAVAAGPSSCRTCAVQTDGTLDCFGTNNHGQCNVPSVLGPVTAVAASDLSHLRLANRRYIRML